MNMEHPDGYHRGLQRHGLGNQSADRGAGGDAVTMLYGHAVGHKAAHGEACKEDAVSVQVILYGQGVQQGQQKTHIIDVAIGQSRAPHSADSLIQGLGHDDGPTQLVRQLGKMILLVTRNNLDRQAMKIEHHRDASRSVGRSVDDVFTFLVLPGKMQDLCCEEVQAHRQNQSADYHFFLHTMDLFQE